MVQPVLIFKGTMRRAGNKLKKEPTFAGQKIIRPKNPAAEGKT